MNIPSGKFMASHVEWLFLLILGCFTNIAMTSQITGKYSGASVEAVLGSDFTFTWKYMMTGPVGSQPKTITWGLGLQAGAAVKVALVTAQPSAVTINSNLPPKYKGRVAWTGNWAKREASFNLSSVTRDDEAVYGLSILFDTFTTETDSVNLSVLVPANFTKVPLAVMKVKEGDDLTLECVANGEPTPNVTWALPNGTSVTGRGASTLRISNIKRPAGQATYKFECRASNIPGKDPIKRQTEVTVQYPPEGTRLTGSPSPAVQGDPVTFTCAVTGALPSVDKYGFHFNSSSGWVLKHETKDGRYTINNVQGSHQGMYKCVPSNAAGTGKNAAFQLTVNVPPVITRPPQDKTVRENATLLLTCEASGQPRPTITWSKDGVQQSSPGNRFEISSIKRSQAGTYTCTADNQVKVAKTAGARVTVEYEAQIRRLRFSPGSSSWIGQTVYLKCETDGVPEPNITLYKPDNTTLTRGTGKTITKDVPLTEEEDFGDYRCQADNGFSPAAKSAIKLTQIVPPYRPSITLTDEDIGATSLTVRWSAPADDGGRPVTGYRVVLRLQESSEVEKELTVGEQERHADVGGLEKSTRYKVEVSAINVAGEGLPGTEEVTTKNKGVPEAATLKVTTDKRGVFELQWTKPEENGFPITSYTIYTKVVSDNENAGEWELVKTVNEDVLEYTLNLEAEGRYQIVVTANNSIGEAKKEDGKIQTVVVPAAPVMTGAPTGKRVGGGSGDGLTIGVAVGAVLFALVAVALVFLLWRKRQQRSKGGRSSSSDELSGDDGYEDVSRRRAARQLRGAGAGASVGAGDDACVYAQVDKSKKKPKKAKKKPGEPGDLVYAELADFSRPQGGAVPVRPDQIQRSDYADIGQFTSQRRQEPTYDNLPRADATYANVQGM